MCNGGKISGAHRDKARRTHKAQNVCNGYAYNHCHDKGDYKNHVSSLPHSLSVSEATADSVCPSLGTKI